MDRLGCDGSGRGDAGSGLVGGPGARRRNSGVGLADRRDGDDQRRLERRGRVLAAVVTSVVAGAVGAGALVTAAAAGARGLGRSRDADRGLVVAALATPSGLGNVLVASLARSRLGAAAVVRGLGRLGGATRFGVLVRLLSGLGGCLVIALGRRLCRGGRGSDGADGGVPRNNLGGDLTNGAVGDGGGTRGDRVDVGLVNGAGSELCRGRRGSGSGNGADRADGRVQGDGGSGHLSNRAVGDGRRTRGDGVDRGGEHGAGGHGLRHGECVLRRDSG